MLLALDVGNTNTVLGLYRTSAEPTDTGSAAAVLPERERELVAHWRVTTHRIQTSDEYGVLFVNLFQMSGISVDEVHHIIISSVVPPVEGTLRRVCEKYFHVQPLFVEPGINQNADVKFRDLPAGDALKKLLGNSKVDFKTSRAKEK